MAQGGGFLQAVEVIPERIQDRSVYPYSIPSIGSLTLLPLSSGVTIFVGENGSGKSTLIEAIAIAAGFNAEGGSKNFRFSVQVSESDLHASIRLRRSANRERTGFFLRAENLFNLGAEIERLDRIPAAGPPVIWSYGGRSLHELSHGESLLAVVRNRFGPTGLYLLDEPESALSPQHQLALLALIHDSVQHQGSQYVIATHSVVLMAYPGATIYCFGEHGITKTTYDELEHVQLMADFMRDRERFLYYLLRG
jgi:predicted ATPase